MPVVYWPEKVLYFHNSSWLSMHEKPANGCKQRYEVPEWPN
jgi:hypothetical protein